MLSSYARRAAVGLLLVVAQLVSAAGVAAATQHCPDHRGNPAKVESGRLNDIVLPAGTRFCVKGATNATGILTADGVRTLFSYLGNGHDVSYYIVYASPELGAPPKPELPESPTKPQQPSEDDSSTQQPKAPREDDSSTVIRHREKSGTPSEPALPMLPDTAMSPGS